MEKQFPYRICYVEDSNTVSEIILPGFEVLLDAEVDHFITTDKALEDMRETGFDKYGVYVFDNQTGFDNMSGIELAKLVRENNPEAIVVSLNASDMEEVREFGIEKLKELGIEFWYKISESFLMMGWIADCVKEGKMISRNEWLTSIGETTEYLGTTDEARPKELALRRICRNLSANFAPDLKDEVRGILMKREVGPYLEELAPSKSGIERK